MPETTWNGWVPQIMGSRTMRTLMVGVLALVTLTACGGSGKDETPTPAPTATTAAPATVVPTTPSTPQISLGSVIFATDADAATGGPAAPTESFIRSTQTVRAFVQAGALPAGTVVRVDWAINGVAVPTLMQEFTLSAERPAGWLEFSLDRTTAQPWPSGTLTATVTVDGATTVTGDAALSGF